MGWRPVLLAASALALASGASAQAPPPQPTISIRQSPKTVSLGASVEIGGKLAGVQGGNGERTVQLEQTAHPYVIQRTVDTTTTAQDGSYSFFVTPGRNSRFHVLLSSDRSVSSRSKQVYVNPLLAASFDFVRHGGRMTVKITTPPDIRLAHRKMYFYLSKRFGKPYRLVRKRRLRASAPGVAGASARFRLRRGSGWATIACLKSLVRLGLGSPRADRRLRCGRRRIGRPRTAAAAVALSSPSAARAR